jgi:D-amino peptidase
MRVYISADIEGITGLVSWSQCGRPDGQHYDYGFARRMMTHDVNAAIRGARAAGAKHIRIKDSHGNSKNLLIDQLEPGVELVSGHGSRNDGMMIGIDESYDAALLIGYHARAGTQGGIMEHTITGGIHRLWVNGEDVGEIGLSAGVAGRYGVPLAFISSDQAGCDEAASLLPGIGTFAVKEGYGRYMGRLLHPSETGPAIEKGVENALKKIATKPWVPAEPATIRIEFNRAEEADTVGRANEVKRLDGYTCEVTYPTYHEAHQAAWMMFAMSGVGSRSGE